MIDRSPNPAPTLENFVPPLRGYPYFERRAAFPFVPRTNEFQLVDAGWLIDASLLAYESGEDGVLAALESAQVPPEELSPQVVVSGGTQCVALVAPGFAILAFRGTRLERFPDPIDTLRGVFSSGESPAAGEGFITPNWDDTLTDANFLPNGDGVHRGFAEAVDSLFRDGFADLLAGLGRKPVWFTGHSLGAALATLAAMRGGVSAPQGLYTFGSPRVGNAAFARAFTRAFPHPCFRFVHGSDIVTAVPPSLPLMGYEPVGELKYISERGDLRPDAGSGAIALDRLEGSITKAVGGLLADLRIPFSRGKKPKLQIPFAALADHAPLYYANSIWQALRDRRTE